MSSGKAALLGHLGSGDTTVARAYAVTRKDGVVLGFTDHDRDLTFEGIVFRAGTGLTAKAVAQSTGLAVDNTEAFGALSSEAIRETDILAGRYDGAEVRIWLVNWADVSARMLQFRGRVGDGTRGAGAFTAELRGLADQLNQPQGRIYHGRCSAVLGDRRCSFDTNRAGYALERAVETVREGREFTFASVAGVPARWFEGGLVRVLSGAAAGRTGQVKNDRSAGGKRAIELWQSFAVAPEPGDLMRIEAGCDKAAATCRVKFENFVNFRGFPDIPGEDWLLTYPVRAGVNDGGSLRG